MDCQPAHRDYDSKYVCLEEKYLQTMELKLKAIEEKHFLDLKQDWRSQNMHIQCKEDQRYQETQEQKRVLNDQCQQYIQKQHLALEQQYKRLLQKQERDIKDQYGRNNELGDQALDEKFKRYKQERDLHPKAKEASYSTSVEQDYRQGRPGLCQHIEKSPYGTCRHSTPSADGRLGYYADDESSTDSQTSVCQSSRKTSPTTTVSSITTLHIGGTTNTPRSCVTMSPSVSSEQLSFNTSSCSTSMPQSPTYGTQLRTDTSWPVDKTTRSSVGKTDVSGPVQQSIETKPPSERTNWFTSFINEQIPHIFNQLRSSDIPQMCDKQQLKDFMAFLEEQNVLGSLQDVAEKAVAKLMSKSVMPVDIAMCKLGLTDESCSTGQHSQRSKVAPPSTSAAATEMASFNIDSSSSRAPNYLPEPCSDQEDNMSLSSLEDYISKMGSSRPPSGFWDRAPLQDSAIPTCKKEDIQRWKCKSPFLTTDLSCSSPQKTYLSSAKMTDKTWTSYHLPELLFIGSVCSSVTDVLTEKDSYPPSVDTSCINSDVLNNRVPDSHDFCSPDRYAQFLELLEKKKVFPALEEVVNKAINLLLKYERKEKSTSIPTTSDSSPSRTLNQNSNPAKVTCASKNDQPVYQVYNVQIHQEVGPRDLQEHGPNPPQVPLAPQTLRTSNPMSPLMPRPVPRQSPAPSPIQVPEQPFHVPNPRPRPCHILKKQPMPEVAETDIESAFTMSSQPSPYPTEQTETTSMTSEFVTATGPSTATREMDQTYTSREMGPTLTSKSIRSISTGKTKNTSASSRATASTTKTKSTNSKTRAKARLRKGSDSMGSKSDLTERNLVTRWVSLPPRNISTDSCSPSFMPSCAAKLNVPGMRKFTNEEILHCLIEGAVNLMVYKHKMERRLASKIGFDAKAITDLYYQQMAKLKGTDCFEWPVFIQPLSLHEQHCLASHPLWASSKTTNRLHLAWQSKVGKKKRTPHMSSTDISYQNDSSSLPDIHTTLSATTSLHSAFPRDTITSPSISINRIPIPTLPKL